MKALAAGHNPAVLMVPRAPKQFGGCSEIALRIEAKRQKVGDR